MIDLARGTGNEIKGGEALTETAGTSVGDRWHVLWTRSHCEQSVHDQLAAHGFAPFLPMVQSWCRRRGVRQLVRVPLFQGYLFLRHHIDKSSYVQVCKTRGLVRVLGERWDRLAVVPDADIEAIRKITGSGAPVLAHPYLRTGQRVRVTRGPLAGVEGIVVRSDPKKGLLVVSIDALRRSVAVHLDCTLLEAA
jgi:transcription antitermination factor NusG